MPITQVRPHAKFSFQINWALQHMIKIHNSNEEASSLLKISLSEKERKKLKNSLACLQSGEK
jgi:acyl-CoA hydrolase